MYNLLFFFLQRLRADISALERQLANARKELEKETLQRVDLENRVQSLKEDLAFKTQVHQQVRQILDFVFIYR